MSYTCYKIFVTHTDRHFPEVVKLCSVHPKTCEFVKNLKSKIFTKPILSSIYKEESKKIDVQRNLQKFHKPVTQEIVKYEKSNKEVVEKIRNAIENISFPTLESSKIPEIDFEPSIFEKLI